LNSYFPKENSIYFNSRTNIPHALETIANRFIGDNAEVPFTFRTSRLHGFKREANFKYVFNFDEIFPNTPNEYVVYAWSKLWSGENKKINLSMNCFSPLKVYCNGERAVKSNTHDDTDPDTARSFPVELKKGWNYIVLESKKANSGFGCKFGTASMKGMPLHFVIGSIEREGQEGWLYSTPMEKPLENIISDEISEQLGNITWLPKANWSNDELKKGQFERIYTNQENVCGFGWTKAKFTKFGKNSYTIAGKSFGKLIGYFDGKEILFADGCGSFNVTIEAAYGEYDLILKSYSDKAGWGFELDKHDGIELSTPVAVKGMDDVMIYIGAFNSSSEISVYEISSLSTVFDTVQGKSYWRADAPDTAIRPFQEGKSLFGKWNYPLGVTLYGLIRSARELNDEKILNYVTDHIGLCTEYFSYSVWDRQTYGAPGINYQISGIDSLDDCGSFASTMLELAKDENINLPGFKATADFVADYITNKQARRPDGALFRKNCHSPFMEDTMWVDDLYMSVPFLTRYYSLTGEKSYIDDAARQFLLFKKYMYMPEKKIMSHVYNFRIDAPTQVPWGRGNGWVLFSLTELLAVLPQNHELREELLGFFRELSEGYLALQDEEGMWHQVLTDHESYQESSCTSMFAYAFSRGVRFGWLKENKDKYINAVFKAWEALSKTAIDKYGNIYGVCKGSGYSYTPSYYKDELGWNLNDTHGIGIVMLAGIETLTLQKFLQTSEIL